MAAFAGGSSRKVRARARNTHLRNHNDLADSVEAVAIDGVSMATSATRGDSAVAELGVGKCGHPAGGTGGGNLHRRYAVDVAGFAGQIGRIGHVLRNQPGKRLGHHTIEGAAVDRTTVTVGTARCNATVAEGRARKLGAIGDWRGLNAGVASYVAAFAA